ncbi:MAG: sulfotransferase domain-containing protein [Alphaproteobacteria bacterium]|nr:sulfotransferase domain-containing protein [Alphaproteobacteria bacterium]
MPASRAPVTWLASYPRSGNTLLRTILKRCFGQSSQSVYDDTELSDPDVSEMIGREPVGEDPRDFIARSRESGRSLYVKTHEMPPADHHPSIYVVRDGRSAVVSHTHYLREIMKRDITLAEVIEGKSGQNWSAHVRAWMPRSHTLLVRYEDLAAGDAATLKKISTFIGKPQLHAFDISFEALHALSPVFFRVGSDSANILEMDGEMQRLFERLHGETLRAMGYGAPARGASRSAGANA